MQPTLRIEARERSHTALGRLSHTATTVICLWNQSLPGRLGVMALTPALTRFWLESQMFVRWKKAHEHLRPPVARIMPFEP